MFHFYFEFSQKIPLAVLRSVLSISQDIPSGEELLTWFERSKIKRNGSGDKNEEKPIKGKGEREIIRFKVL